MVLKILFLFQDLIDNREFPVDTKVIDSIPIDDTFSSMSDVPATKVIILNPVDVPTPGNQKAPLEPVDTSSGKLYQLASPVLVYCPVIGYHHSH